MIDLISRSALKERFKLRMQWLAKDIHDQYSLGLSHGCETDAGLIDEAPTIDAVPVVRCKDCKHWQRNMYAYKEQGTCRGLTFLGITRHENDFCCRGEKEVAGGSVQKEARRG